MATLYQDANHNPIQTAVGYSLTDASETPNVSPIGAGTDEISLVAPDNAIGLVVMPIDANAELRSNGGTYPLAYGVEKGIPCKGGSVVVIGRPNSTAVAFAFETL